MAKEDPRLGSWREAPLGTFSQDGVVDPTNPVPEYQESKPARPTVSQGLVEIFRAFQESPLGQARRINRIYYPSCALDTSLSVGFPNANVVYADIDEGAISSLQEEGHDAISMDATTWVPDEEMDMVLLLNPVISSRVPSRAVRPGGYVLANNYHATADELHEDSEFSFVGVIRRDPVTGRQIVDIENLEECWQEVESDEEFRSAPFSFLYASYEDTERVVQEVFGDTDNVLERYKQLIREEREVASLPRKKGTADDMFIFKRKEQEDARPDWIKNNEKGRGNTVVDGEVYPFTVLDRELEPGLPGFVGFPGAEHLLASEDIPPKYRQYILRHEVREYTQFKDQQGKCLTSLKRELEDIPENIRNEYIAYRREFFRKLVDFYQDSDDGGFKREIQASSDYLQSL